jgi:hypothetical protein
LALTRQASCLEFYVVKRTHFRDSMKAIKNPAFFGRLSIKRRCGQREKKVRSKSSKGVKSFSPERQRLYQ